MHDEYARLGRAERHLVPYLRFSHEHMSLIFVSEKGVVDGALLDEDSSLHTSAWALVSRFVLL